MDEREVAALSDSDLLAMYLGGDGEGAIADMLAAELQRRNIDI